MKARLTIRFTVVSVFIFATLVTATLAIGLQYYFGQSLAKDTARDLYNTALAGVANETRGLARTNSNILNLLSDNKVLLDPAKQHSQLEIFTRVLAANPLFYGVYVGKEDGSFFEVINLDANRQTRAAHRAAPVYKWLVVTVSAQDGVRKRVLRYLDSDLNERISRSEVTDFDPRERQWYINAMESDGIYRSDAYLFDQLGIPGRTLSRQISDKGAVVGIDLTLESLSGFLRDMEVSRQSSLYMYNDSGQVFASSVEADPESTKLPIPELSLTKEELAYLQDLDALTVSNEMYWPPFDYTKDGKPQGYSIDVIKMIGEMLQLEVNFINGYSWSGLVEKFQDGSIDILQSVILTENNETWGLATQGYAHLPYGVATRSGVEPIKSLSQLSGKQVAIPAGWSILPLVKESFPDVEVVETESTSQSLDMVKNGAVFAALDNEVILRYITRHNFMENMYFHPGFNLGKESVPDKLHMLVASDKPQLHAILNKAIAAIGPAQRGYLKSQWLDFEEGVPPAQSASVPHAELANIAEYSVLHNQMRFVDHLGQIHLVYAAPVESKAFLGIMAPLDTVLAPFLDKVKLSIFITACGLLLTLPLSWVFATPIIRPVRQLADENEKVMLRHYDEVTRIPSRIKELDELSDSMVEMVAAIQAHELAQRELMDSFIRLIAQAIDDKSAYTGGHCARVPELALMLATEASASEQPPFDDFKLSTDDEWREYRIAAWLHDCGKITTPEHIVDKGSKLETIYNRIHEVRMRFEVLWRDAEIQQLKERLPDSELQSLTSDLEDIRRQLRDDFAFVADCNVGGEFLDQEKLDRLAEIATRNWERNFSDRLGLSPVEELRVHGKDSLPTTEALIQDKPEHIIPRTRSTDYPPEFGINMDIPEHLYNQGELYNLSVSRGTLTSEDRFKINEHMISTIKMLESLPFPEEMQNVPRYASTHHETMRGSGYPRKLPGAALSIPERILAVADVFEALTASDRPYKKAKPVSVAIDILHKMVEDDHIDRDCFELFISSGVYLKYAQEHLDPSQIDEVDAGSYLRSDTA